MQVSLAVRILQANTPTCHTFKLQGLKSKFKEMLESENVAQNVAESLRDIQDNAKDITIQLKYGFNHFTKAPTLLILMNPRNPQSEKMYGTSFMSNITRAFKVYWHSTNNLKVTDIEMLERDEDQDYPPLTPQDYMEELYWERYMGMDDLVKFLTKSREILPV